MKTAMHLLLTSLLIASPLLASGEDENIEQQCLYEVYGEGSNSQVMSGYLMGTLAGMYFMTDAEDQSETIQNLSVQEGIALACQNALNNRSSNGFHYDFNNELARIVSKRYE